MFLIEAIPIAKGVSTDTLSYFSVAPLTVGSLVSVPLRKKLVPAIVLSSETASKSKSAIRSGSYGLKKVGSVISEHFLPQTFLAIVAAVAEKHAVSIGSVLFTLVPQALLRHTEKWLELPEKTFESKKVWRPEFIEGNEEAVIKELRKKITGAEKKGSVLIIAPSIGAAEQISKRLGTKDGFTFHSSVAKGKYLKQWTEAVMSPFPIVIICTPGFAYIPRKDIGSIILTDEGSDRYKTESRPLLDMRIYAEELARTIGAELTLTGYPGIETEWRIRQEEIKKTVLEKDAEGPRVNIVQMMKYEHERRPEWQEIISSDLLNEIKKNRHSFIFSVRKGLATTIVCGDCGQSVRCNVCNAPVILIKGSPHNIFACRACKTKRSAAEACISCGSWKLVGYGVGRERITEVLEKELPDISVFSLDRETAKTSKQIGEIVQKFYAAERSVLVGTETALHALTERIELSGIASFETLFSLPDLSVNEKIFRILEKIKEKTEKQIVIQTRQRGLQIKKFLANDSWKHIYDEEIALRHTLGYPPFKKLIKLWRVVKEKESASEQQTVKKLFKEIDHQTYFGAKNKFGVTLNCLLKVNSQQWPDEKIVQKLESLPLAWNIDTNPTYLG